jgi:ATP-GRASP peptide maturase of grasp-with-spasm system
MILIISHDDIDEPTNDIMDWLRFFEYRNFIRINGDDLNIDSDFDINFEKKIIEYRKNGNLDRLNINKISCVFYRRWSGPTNKKPLYEKYIKNNFNTEDVKLVQNFQSYINREYNQVVNYFHTLLLDKFWLPESEKERKELYKSETLFIMEKYGIKIPKTLITTNKKSLYNFFKDCNNNIITKPIRDVAHFMYNKFELRMYTKQIFEEDIEIMPNNFFHCLFQEKIEKEFEIRTFFLNEKFYSMAIFSQSDIQTEVDFRRYNLKKPNRSIPFELPKNLEKRLSKALKELKLNTGSIDFLYNTKDGFIFLEVNPVGQIGMTSHTCNYPVESEITKILIQEDNGRVQN